VFTDKPVHELEALGELDMEQGFDEAVLAIDPAEFTRYRTYYGRLNT
jgi:hypothetical protein